jgi:hypothetical protein
VPERVSDRPPSRTAPPIALFVAGALLIGACAGFLAAWTRKPTLSLPPASSSVVEVRATPSVITALKDLARLESAEAHIERVIDLKDKQSRLFGLIEGEDAILLIASGSVTAGVDLSKLREGDVVVHKQDKRVTIQLPPAEILSKRLDSERTYVHSRETDLLAKRKESLETRARQEAEKSLVEAAREGGLIPRAEANARRTVESLVRSLGYDRVEVTFRAAPH